MTKQYTGQPEWRHATRPMWVTYYPGTLARAEHWQAYRATESSNRRIGDERGFASSEAAIAACEAFPA